MISPISNFNSTLYGGNSAGSGQGYSSASAIGFPKGNIPAQEDGRIDGKWLPGSKRGKAEQNDGIEDPLEECQTCKKRKYKDGSDEMVSFKSPQHVSPESAASAVRAHEQEHVSNAYKKAANNNGKVISASVSIKTAVCPECGRTYVSGGTTHTQIKYYNEDNPYQKDLKSSDRTKYLGMNLDYAV